MCADHMGNALANQEETLLVLVKKDLLGYTVMKMLMTALPIPAKMEEHASME